MKVLLHNDGSLEFDSAPNIDLSQYIQITPLLYKPRHPLCILRKNRCRLSPCGKRMIFEWFCKHFEKNVNYKNCEECKARKEA